MTPDEIRLLNVVKDDPEAFGLAKDWYKHGCYCCIIRDLMKNVTVV